jgi:N-acetyl-gamma-glutamyl-phosphate reductase
MNPTDSAYRSAYRVGILHGAGYVGRELARLILGHPRLVLGQVTSRTFAGEPLGRVHRALRGQTKAQFSAPADFDAGAHDALFVAAEHGQSVALVDALLEGRYDGAIVDLSADFRYADASHYVAHFGYEHPREDLLERFVYRVPEIHGALPEGAKYVANPGCFATAVQMALWPLAQHAASLEGATHVTALTGASGSGGRPKPATHFPDRDGNVRAYKVLRHQHAPEIAQTLAAASSQSDSFDFTFVPTSGPWTRGIWGTAQVRLAGGVGASEVAGWFEAAYGDAPLVRLEANALPELLPVVGTAFADIGWVVEGRDLAVGFAIDNLVRGAAGQAVQNLNAALGLDETAGLTLNAERSWNADFGMRNAE